MLKETAGGEEGIQERIVLLEVVLRQRGGNPDTIGNDRERSLSPNSKKIANRRAVCTKKVVTAPENAPKAPLIVRQLLEKPVMPRGRYTSVEDVPEEDSDEHDQREQRKQTTYTQTSGTSKPTIYEWFRNMEMKLDYTEFHSDRTKGTVAEYLEAHMPSARRKQQSANVFTSANEMLEDLDTRFGESDRNAKAHADLANLKQG
ncbi:hypothetical protein LTR85_003212 [Meristemomyces frigidus]|nr:hypothetical protein LTR85_003212 [Meristemomyces frigidus]